MSNRLRGLIRLGAGRCQRSRAGTGRPSGRSMRTISDGGRRLDTGLGHGRTGLRSRSVRSGNGASTNHGYAGCSRSVPTRCGGAERVRHHRTGPSWIAVGRMSRRSETPPCRNETPRTARPSRRSGIPNAGVGRRPAGIQTRTAPRTKHRRIGDSIWFPGSFARDPAGSTGRATTSWTRRDGAADRRSAGRNDFVPVRDGVPPAVTRRRPSPERRCGRPSLRRFRPGCGRRPRSGSRRRLSRGGRRSPTGLRCRS